MSRFPSAVRSVLRIFAALAACYALSATLAHFQSLAMMFQPPPPGYEPGPPFISLTASDGTRIMARHWPNPAAKFTLLYFHGNGEDLGRLDYLADYVRAGFAVVSMDYRGYGRSGGTPTEAATYADAQLVYAYVRDQLGVPPARIIPFGFSLGGACATEIAVTQPVAGLVLESTFVSAYRTVTRVPLVVGDKFRNEAKLARLRCPVLIMHGTQDEILPFWHGEALYAAAREPKRKLFVEGAGHGWLQTVAGDRYWQTLREFAAALP